MSDIPVIDAVKTISQYRHKKTGAIYKTKEEWKKLYDNILFFNAPYLTEVASDGSYKVTDIRNQSEVLIDINTNMLSLSIKHLENFVR